MCKFFKKILYNILDSQFTIIRRNEFCCISKHVIFLFRRTDGSVQGIDSRRQTQVSDKTSSRQPIIYKRGSTHPY